MRIYRRVNDLREYLSRERAAGKRIAYVPTMGALHDGHFSLMRAAAEYDVRVCSIFVNPTQFNNPEDLEKYPQTLAQDIEGLMEVETDVLFYPHVEEIYPPGSSIGPEIELGHLAEIMEGKHRPGHFDGVVQVVHRLLEIVEPEVLIMGQKDLQQHTIIAHMIRSLELPVELIVCPTRREDSGLAMSSRNRRLSVGARAQASIIYETLCALRERIDDSAFAEWSQWASTRLTEHGLEPEYVAIVEGSTLLPARPDDQKIVACLAAWIEGVRLIDNMVLRP